MLRVLSVDGGGYLGLATATFIEGIEQHFGKKFSDQFDLFCGTSTGAIIALALAAGKSGGDLRSFYTALGGTVLSSRWGHGRVAWIAQLFTPRYATEPLRKALVDVFGDMTLQDLSARDKKIVVTSFCLTRGQPRIFKTNHSANLTRHGGYRVVDIALATAAAPIFFPLVQVCDPLQGVTETFCDGGVVANHPALIAYSEAVGELAAKPRDVRLLSISTPRTDLAVQEPIATGRGIWAWREQLVSAFIDGGAHVSGQVLKRIVESYPLGDRPLYERVELQNKHRLAFDDASHAATQALVSEGASQAASNELRRRLAPFFT